MGIYIFNMLSIPIYHLFIKNKKVLTIIISLQMFFILALRDITIGVDLDNYIGGFEYISGLRLSELISRLHIWNTADLTYGYAYESGYVVLNWIIAKIGFDFHGFLVVCAAMNMISFGTFIYRYSRKPWLSFVLFAGLGMYQYSFGILRQTLALSIVLWTIPYMLEQKWAKVTALIFIAFTFHRTAILFIVLWYLSKYAVTRKVFRYNMAVWLGLFTMAPILYRTIITKFLLLIGKSTYIDLNFQLNNQVILLFVITLIIYFFVSFYHFSSKEDRLIVWGFLLTMPVAIIGMCNDVFARSMEFYYIFVILLIPNIIDTYQNQVIYYSLSGKNYCPSQAGIITRFAASSLILVLMTFFMIYTLTNSPLVPFKLYQ